MKILIYGFGRMGLTHFSIINSLIKNVEFYVIEPNSLLRRILNNNINADFYKDDSKLNDGFDITLITTPPFVHIKLLEKCLARGDKKIFVEKPFGGYNNVNFSSQVNSAPVFIGYVLRFNPCIQWLKDNLDTSHIKSINAQYLSNTIEKKPNGWRNGRFSGVLNEMGSHILDLILYLISEDSLDVISASKKSVISDVDDIVSAKLVSKNKIDVSIYLNWVKKDVRKPVFGINIILKNGTNYEIDQQQIKIIEGGKTKTISVTDIKSKVPYYLRGIDFTSQMVDLTGKTHKMASYSEALSVNNIMKNIYNYEANIGG